jgi:hypothetical protein
MYHRQKNESTRCFLGTRRVAQCDMSVAASEPPSCICTHDQYGLCTVGRAAPPEANALEGVEGTHSTTRSVSTRL